PSTLRRMVGLAERELAMAVDERDGLAAALAVDTADHQAVAATARALAEADARVAAAEERWLSVAQELEG
ncbi:MAG: ABC transporter ATP-binding protein, partial [Acidimicrobiales bacterium]